MPNSYKIIIVLMLSALATPLVACQDRRTSARSPAAPQGDSTPSTLLLPDELLLPGEESGCRGAVCGYLDQ
jgi:hypothetical protein